jgi:O-antigen/teichoic acid export membrane protein
MTVDAAEARLAASDGPNGRSAAAQGVSPAPAMPKHVARDLLGGTSALGLGVIIERGCGFLANVLAARLGGAATFGAYSLAVTTANNISTYAAGGIGSTAIRFSGRYPRESSGYRTLSRVLLIISVASAALAALGLWAGAPPIAHLLGKPALTSLLRWAALSAAGMILLECCRGFLVGQRRLLAILLLSLTVGVGMLSLLPLTSRWGAVPMICSQGGITLGAVGLCLLLYRPLGLAPVASDAAAEPLGPMLRGVWSFGLIQLAGLIGMNAAGWWLTSLVARSSMVEMGFFAISNQLRNIVALAPSLLTESSLAVMAQGENVENTPDQVMAVCTLATTFASLLLAGIGIVLVPWGLTLIYGKAYAAASAATAIALATAVVHMGGAPAAARLSIVSIKSSGVINTIWAVLVAVSATLFLFWGGNASKGALIYFVAQIFSSGLVFFSLTKRSCVPAGMNKVFILGTAASLSLAALAVLRERHAEWTLLLTAAMIAICLCGLAALLLLGRRECWIPSLPAIKRLLAERGLLGSRSVASSTTGGFDA